MDTIKTNDLATPVNINEKMQYAQIQRLDAICHMLSDLVEAYGKVNNLGVEEVKVIEQTPTKATTTKTTKKRSTTPRKPRKTTVKSETSKEE